VAEEPQPEAEICCEVDVCLDYLGNHGWDRIRDFHSCWWRRVETAQSAVDHWVTDMGSGEAGCTEQQLTSQQMSQWNILADTPAGC